MHILINKVINLCVGTSQSCCCRMILNCVVAVALLEVSYLPGLLQHNAGDSHDLETRSADKVIT